MSLNLPSSNCDPYAKGLLVLIAHCRVFGVHTADDWTALHYAAWKARPVICELLLQKKPPFGSNVNRKNDCESSTRLFCMATRKNSSAMPRTESLHALQSDGGTALHLAAHGSDQPSARLHVCKLLLDQGRVRNCTRPTWQISCLTLTPLGMD